MAITEDDLEQLCIQWLQSMGYQHLHGETLSPGGSSPERAKYADTILNGRLESALQRCNPSLSSSAIDEGATSILAYLKIKHLEEMVEEMGSGLVI